MYSFLNKQTHCELYCNIALKPKLSYFIRIYNGGSDFLILINWQTNEKFEVVILLRLIEKKSDFELFFPQSMQFSFNLCMIDS